ncbi:hypothetical protein [Vibrio phage VpKK5]|uniref:hypothetical protein n=1 Tax=Vibrio phage VpKK5 TaxID=1538804 RepID=UPI0004F70A72|nr:hypothetical protein VC55_gp10 [Vibrio phage VpKK5]AIM40594.1 hypothetical protein [Vibrio phage VpKK5]
MPKNIGWLVAAILLIIAFVAPELILVAIGLAVALPFALTFIGLMLGKILAIMAVTVIVAILFG